MKSIIKKHAYKAGELLIVDFRFIGIVVYRRELPFELFKVIDPHSFLNGR
ncbi:hypothetical protein [Dysgonomonas termitidis]